MELNNYGQTHTQSDRWTIDQVIAAYINTHICSWRPYSRKRSTPHHTTLQQTESHHTTPHRMTLHHTTLNHITPHHTTPHRITPHHYYDVQIITSYGFVAFLLMTSLTLALIPMPMLPFPLAPLKKKKSKRKKEMVGKGGRIIVIQIKWVWREAGRKERSNSEENDIMMIRKERKKMVK